MIKLTAGTFLFIIFFKLLTLFQLFRKCDDWILREIDTYVPRKIGIALEECNRRQSIRTMTGHEADRPRGNSKENKEKGEKNSGEGERRTCRWAFLQYRSELHRRSAHPEQRNVPTLVRPRVCSVVQSRFHFRSFRRLSSYSWRTGRTI